MTQRERVRPAGRESNGARELGSGETSSSLESVAAHLDRFAHDVLLDAFLSADSAYWMRRAEDFERAKPDPDRDSHGAASLDDLRGQWCRLDDIARACRARAEVSADVRDVVTAVLREVAA